MARRRHTLAAATNSRGRILTIQADSEVEERIAEGSLARISELVKSDLPQSLKELIAPITKRGEGEIVLVLRNDLKAKATLFLQQCQLAVKVCTFSEIEFGLKTELVGVWRSQG